MKKTLAVFMILAIFLLSGCAARDIAPDSGQGTTASPPAAAYQKTTAEEARRIMDETKGYVTLDVRTKDEYDQGHIEGAVLLPVTDIVKKAGEHLKEKDQVILVYCRSGNRSAQAAQLLIDMGYTKVYDFGGIIDWPYETTTGK